MAEIANTLWYRLGTISATDGSTKVTGVGTHFTTAGINPGATLRVDGRPYAYEVKRVVSDTELELATPYYGGNISSASYSIDRNFQSTTNAKLAADVTDLVGLYEQVRDGTMLTIEGKSAYQVAVANGFKGTESEWLESLKGAGEISTINTKLSRIFTNSAAAHNSVYRGKNLGSALTAEQSAAIRNGSFDDIYPGDYWVFSNIPYTYYGKTSDTTAQTGKTYYADATGTALETQPETGADISGAGYFEKLNKTYSGTMRVADLDYYLRAGDTDFTAHHAVVVPDTSMFLENMNPMNPIVTTEGGYVGSKMRTVYLRRAEAIFKACFGENHVLKHREYLVNAVANGKASAGAWCDSFVELMDERMVYGSAIFDSANPDGGSTVPNRYSVSYMQLAAFRHMKALLSNRQEYWLRNVVSRAWFASVNNKGSCSYTDASFGLGVRPAALIY